MPNKRARRHAQAVEAPESQPSGVERWLAMVAALLAGIALLGFVVTLAWIALRDAFPWLNDTPLPYSFLVPVFALPAAFVCVLTLIGFSAVRRGRAASS